MFDTSLNSVPESTIKSPVHPTNARSTSWCMMVTRPPQTNQKYSQCNHAHCVAGVGDAPLEQPGCRRFSHDERQVGARGAAVPNILINLFGKSMKLSEVNFQLVRESSVFVCPRSCCCLVQRLWSNNGPAV